MTTHFYLFIIYSTFSNQITLLYFLTRNPTFLFTCSHTLPNQCVNFVYSRRRMNFPALPRCVSFQIAVRSPLSSFCAQFFGFTWMWLVHSGGFIDLVIEDWEPKSPYLSCFAVFFVIGVVFDVGICDVLVIRFEW